MALEGSTRFGGGSIPRISVSTDIGGIPLDIDFDLPSGGGGGEPVFRPAVGFPCATGFMLNAARNDCIPIPGTGTVARPLGLAADPLDAGCPIFQSPDPITGECRLDLDPGPGQGFPGGNGAAGGGLNRPRATSRTVLECPTFADGKKGILWMNALTGDVVCLPRRTSGKGFGLIRKNPPRQKPFISAAEKRLLTKISSVQKRAKKFAMDAGFACKKR